MSLIDRLLQELFPEKDKGKSPIKEVLVREMIKRSQVFAQDYKVWKEQDMHLGLLAHVNENRHLRLANPDAQVNYFRYTHHLSNGFYFHGEDPWNSNDYQFFVQHLIDLLKGEEYRLNNATKEVVEENGQLKTVEHFYLKPGLKFRRERPYQQLFGNIEIEHRMVEEETNLVKLMAHVYQDRNFQEPLEFDDLMQKIFTS
ncbi:MAG: hypothetical protein RIC95_15750 [Vicingaceae bacterium]